MEEVGETGVASGEKTDILDSLSIEGALELSLVMDLSLSFEDFFDAGGGISVTFFSGEPKKWETHETRFNVGMFKLLTTSLRLLWLLRSGLR